jgi:predicted MFS family arabinose efflux permease
LSQAGRSQGLLAVPGYLPLFASSWLWNVTRWGALFICSYLVTNLGATPFLNQVVGASVFAPMLLGGLGAGVLSDRIDRHWLIGSTQAVLIPVSAVMFVLVQTGAVSVWMVFPYVLAIGVGGLVNMTAQRALLYDVVGPRLASRALTLDNVGMASASMVSTLLGGVLIQAFGVGAAFAFLSVAVCLSALCMRWVPRPDHLSLVSLVAPELSVSSETPASAASLRDQVGVGVGLLRGSPPLRSMLGVTVVMNLFCFSFVPLVPVVAKHLGADAFLAGALASAGGMGQFGGGLVLAARDVERRGLAFVGGSLVALFGLGAFALAPSLSVAILALAVGGVGQAAFGSMQSLLAIEGVGQGDRGAALGLLSTAIGALPLGMIFVGVSAAGLGAPLTLLISSAGGLGALMASLRRWPGVLRAAQAVPARGSGAGGI